MKYIVPALTALKTPTQIDIDSCLKLYDTLIDAGLDGVAIFGSSGEFPHLPLEERKKLITAGVKHIAGRMQVLVGTGAMLVDEVAELSSFALDAGADGVMVVGPYYFALDDESAFRHFDAVASQVKGKVYIYNYPDRTGYSLCPKVVLELAKKHGNIAGIKDTVPDMAHTVALIQTIKPELPHFEIFSGFDYNFASNVMAGGDGCIAAVGNIRPGLCASWRDAVKANDMVQCTRYQQLFNDIVAIYGMTQPFMPAMKSALVDMGIFASDAMAFPFAPATEEQKMAVRALLKDI